MTETIPKSTQRRIFVYVALFAVLLLLYYSVRKINWSGSTELHTIMETIATFLALVVGAMALVRFYSHKDDTFLFIGTGFLGTGLLDGYHMVVTSVLFQDRLIIQSHSFRRYDA